MSHKSKDFSHDPCPWFILNNMGGAFVLGSFCSALWHSVKGARGYPAGQRLAGAFATGKTRALVTGGNFATWAGLLTSFECAAAGIRQKHDPWNLIISGALTQSALAARSGFKAAALAAIVGGAQWAVIAGLDFFVKRWTAMSSKPTHPEKPPLQTSIPIITTLYR